MSWSSDIDGLRRRLAALETRHAEERQVRDLRLAFNVTLEGSIGSDNYVFRIPEIDGYLRVPEPAGAMVVTARGLTVIPTTDYDAGGTQIKFKGLQKAGPLVLAIMQYDAGVVASRGDAANNRMHRRRRESEPLLSRRRR